MGFLPIIFGRIFLNTLEYDNYILGTAVNPYKDPRFRYRRRRRVEEKPLPVHVDLGGRIDHMDLPQRFHEDRPEFPQPLVVRPELRFEHRPGDELAVWFGNAVQALRQPGIDIEGHSRVR